MNASAAMPMPFEDQPKNILDMLRIENFDKNSETFSKIMGRGNNFDRSMKPSQMNKALASNLSQR